MNNQRDDFLRYQALRKDPAFAERILIVGRAMLIIFLVAGLVALALATYHYLLTGDGAEGTNAERPSSAKVYFIGFAVAWNLLVIAMMKLNAGMLRNVRQMKDEQQA
jgi:hypothetical protein